ncbi:hypothetical protein IFR04_009852 [Cadophora malorum]|uniref:Uncharacterized protein n=1 Tax=Cadophora malorum TaxID=108018 RepID=A0A8H7W457_9HELO|nr:hypothetical protein IFR04_009852 [Cadophora malorum]
MLVTTILVQSPIFLEICPDRLAQARRLYAEFRIEGIWKNDYSLFIRPHHNVLNFSEWQHLGRFRTAIIFAMQAPKLRKNLKKIMFTPSWVGKKTVTRQKLYSGAFDFCNFLERIGELPSLECIDIVVEGASQGGLWYDGSGFAVLPTNIDGRKTGYQIGDLTYMVYHFILQHNFVSWGEKVPKLRCVKVILPRSRYYEAWAS